MQKAQPEGDAGEKKKKEKKRKKACGSLVLVKGLEVRGDVLNFLH